MLSRCILNFFKFWKSYGSHARARRRLAWFDLLQLTTKIRFQFPPEDKVVGRPKAEEGDSKKEGMELSGKSSTNCNDNWLENEETPYLRKTPFLFPLQLILRINTDWRSLTLIVQGGYLEEVIQRKLGPFLVSVGWEVLGLGRMCIKAVLLAWCGRDIVIGIETGGGYNEGCIWIEIWLGWSSVWGWSGSWLTLTSVPVAIDETFVWALTLTFIILSLTSPKCNFWLVLSWF